LFRIFLSSASSTEVRFFIA